MMNGASGGYVPGGFETQAQAPMPQVQGNEEMLEFLRQVARRQQLARMARPAAPVGPRGNANVGAPSRMINPHDNTDAQMRQLQLRQMQGQVSDADSIRSLRPSPTMLTPAMGGGVIYGYDQQALNPILRKAVNPENAAIINGGQATTGEAGTPIDEDLEAFIQSIKGRY